MNSGIDRIQIIDSTKLDSEHYFQSLLEEACSKGLLGGSDMERVQMECINLLAEKTERFNAGGSSSIRVEKAQDIMASILFTLGVSLKTYPNADDAAAALQRSNINEAYQKGLKRINTLLDVSKVVHTKLLQQLMHTQNTFYRDTLEGGISGFFKLYDPEYTAHEIHITADYPLFKPVPKLAGIEFIKAYLEAAYLENLFCNYFAADDIHRLLFGYAENYQGLLINIYEHVLTAAIGCSIAGADTARLDVSEGGLQHLHGLFADMPKMDILAAIAQAANDLHTRYAFSQELVAYVKGSLPIIACNIKAAAEVQRLDNVFYRPK